MAHFFAEVADFADLDFFADVFPALALRALRTLYARQNDCTSSAAFSSRCISRSASSRFSRCRTNASR